MTTPEGQRKQPKKAQKRPFIPPTHRVRFGRIMRRGRPQAA